MPSTKEGLEKLLDFFVYGMLRASESLGNAPLFMRAVEEAGLRKFLLANMPKFQSTDNATETCAAYTRAADEEGLYNSADSTFRGDDNTIRAEIGDQGPYRRVCTMRHDEGLTVHCVRAFALAEMLRIRLDADFDWKLDRFGRPCRITLTRTPWRQA
jgi:hypothetical protein